MAVPDFMFLDFAPGKKMSGNSGGAAKACLAERRLNRFANENFNRRAAAILAFAHDRGFESHGYHRPVAARLPLIS